MIGRRQPPVSAEQEQRTGGFDSFELKLGDIMRGERATLGKSLLDVQRELKIKATYIAAIENADPTAFETPGFVAGYVRSYARYLGLDPEWAYTTFCEEGKFATVHGMDKAASGVKPAARTPRKPDTPRDPLADPNATFVPRGEAFFSGIEPGAVGSVLVLLMLIGGLGFGGWTVLQQIQRVRLTPVDQAPGVIAEIDPLAGAGTMIADVTDNAGMSAPSADALDRLYRPQPLDVPVMVARDGPISTLQPGALGALVDAPEAPETVAAANRSAPQEPSTPVQVVAETAPELVLFAVRPAWVRVTAAEGTVLLEKILDAGERYVLPPTEEPPLLRTGYAGAVYFAVNGTAYGPAGEGAAVIKNIALGPDELKAAFQLADLTQNPELASLVAEVTQIVEE
jgi:cytoskeletal protein RodZ